ncbi:hypothetical protein SKAU_G00128530 [Synaphobranchus kaupii]|uniref:Uncharacterized protein n=1 Tax=Synaphobranchus kaupii TaxID=118154 RepID=A0A9Q1J0Z2_SYNKA|nr:hypothetical protein SKAU_G00128530 [Synaphobranchus kaupii]
MSSEGSRGLRRSEPRPPPDGAGPRSRPTPDERRPSAPSPAPRKSRGAGGYEEREWSGAGDRRPRLRGADALGGRVQTARPSPPPAVRLGPRRSSPRYNCGPVLKFNGAGRVK